MNERFHIANYPRRRADGNFLPDARGVIQIEEGATIMIELKGISYYTADGPSPQVVFGVQHYTVHEDFRWLNNTFAVAIGEMLPRNDGPTEFIYDIYLVNGEPRP